MLKSDNFELNQNLRFLVRFWWGFLSPFQFRFTFWMKQRRKKKRGREERGYPQCHSEVRGGRDLKLPQNNPAQFLETPGAPCPAARDLRTLFCSPGGCPLGLGFLQPGDFCLLGFKLLLLPPEPGALGGGCGAPPIPEGRTKPGGQAGTYLGLQAEDEQVH